MMKDCTIIFAQFGKRASILNPSLNSFKKYFKDSNIVLYTDMDVSVDGVNIIKIDPFFDKNHRRYGNRCNDYYKVVGLLESKSSLSIAVDSDMKIVSSEVERSIPMTEKFGLCLPINPRFLVKVDGTMGEDVDKVFDETGGYAHAVNMSPIFFNTKDDDMRELLEFYLIEMKERTVRGPLAMWRAIWRKGKMPCLLPPQWCVCLEHCGIGNEIILHEGHQKVRKYYDK